MKPGEKVRLITALGGAEVTLKGEYQPGFWQVTASDGREFVISTHAMAKFQRPAREKP